MPRTYSRHCQPCATLYDLNKVYGPQTKTYDETTPNGWRRTTKHDYDGVHRLGSPRLQVVKRLYVRDSGVNRPIGFICDNGHVTLDDPPVADAHVITKTFPHKVICTLNGEVVQP